MAPPVSQMHTAAIVFAVPSMPSRPFGPLSKLSPLSALGCKALSTDQSKLTTAIKLWLWLQLFRALDGANLSIAASSVDHQLPLFVPRNGYSGSLNQQLQVCSVKACGSTHRQIAHSRS